MSKKNKYLHGYSTKEQKRLIDQAQFLEPWVFKGIHFSKAKHILEVGSGVGAQTEILLRKFPKLKMTCVDISPEQLELARYRLKKYIRQNRVTLVQADATKLPFKSGQFDGAFICWFLEHVPSPDKVLKETARCLKKNSPLFASEVFNSTLFVDPYSPNLLKYWMQFNDLQWTLGGHPFVGAQLGNLLSKSGFKKIHTELRPFFYDSRWKKERKQFIDYWIELLLSAAPLLLKHKRVKKSEISRMKKEFLRIRHSEDSVFFYSWIRAEAVKK